MLLLGFLFLTVVLLVVGGIHWYLWRRLVCDTTERQTMTRRLGTVTIVLLGLVIPGALIGSRYGPDWFAFGYLWLPLMFYLLLALLVLEIPMLVVRRWPRRRAVDTVPVSAAPARDPALVAANTSGGGEAGHGTTAADTDTAGRGDGGDDGDDAAGPTDRDHDPARRLLLARGAAVFAGLTAVAITGYGARTALSAPRIDRLTVPLAKLPRAMDGFRIAVVSDIHLGPLAGRAHAQRIVDVINGLDADLVTIVGDLVDGSVAELGRAAEPLRGLRARRGAYFVTGNHEYFSGVSEWLAEIPSLGIRVLRNERLEIDGLDLAGVDDVTGGESDAGGPDYAAALGDRDRARPVVLMAHQPVQVHEAAKYDVDLQLSGHTHGGQLAPFNLIVRAQQPIVSGFGEVDGTKVYVSNGAGFWGPPVRVGAPPQVGLVQLRTR